MKIQKKKLVGSGGEGSGLWGQDGCEQRIEVFVKIQKKKIGGGVLGGGGGGGGGLGVRMDVNKGGGGSGWM